MGLNVTTGVTQPKEFKKLKVTFPVLPPLHHAEADLPRNSQSTWPPVRP